MGDLVAKCCAILADDPAAARSVSTRSKVVDAGVAGEAPKAGEGLALVVSLAKTEESLLANVSWLEEHPTLCSELFATVIPNLP